MKKDLSRREFLTRTAGATGAFLSARTILLDPERIPLPTQMVAPSDRVRFGMIGIGMQGSGLLKNAIQLPGVECVAAADLYDGRHTLAKEIAGANLPTTRRYQELLDNKEIDCIVAAVPDHWHKQRRRGRRHRRQRHLLRKTHVALRRRRRGHGRRRAKNRPHRPDRLPARQFRDLHKSKRTSRARRNRQI